MPKCPLGTAYPVSTGPSPPLPRMIAPSTQHPLVHEPQEETPIAKQSQQHPDPSPNNNYTLQPIKPCNHQSKDGLRMPLGNHLSPPKQNRLHFPRLNSEANDNHRSNYNRPCTSSWTTRTGVIYPLPIPCTFESYPKTLTPSLQLTTSYNGVELFMLCKKWMHTSYAFRNQIFTGPTASGNPFIDSSKRPSCMSRSPPLTASTLVKALINLEARS